MKRIICIALTLLMLLSCVACSKDNKGEQNVADKPGNVTTDEHYQSNAGNEDESNEPLDENGGWYLQDKEINGWKFKVIYDPNYDYKYDVPELNYEDTTISIAGNTQTVKMLQSPFNYSYDELVEKMKDINFIGDGEKLYPYEMEKILSDCEYTRGFKLEKSGRTAMVQTGGLGVNGTSKISIVFSNTNDDENIVIDQDYAYEILKELVGEKLAMIAVYYSEEDDAKSNDIEDQMSAEHYVSFDEYNYVIKRDISVDDDGKVWNAEFSISIETSAYDEELISLWREYSKEEICDTRYAETKHNCFKKLGVTFDRPLGDTNMKEFFAHCHDGSVKTELESFDYSRSLDWGSNGEPDEVYYHMYCSYHNVADNDNYVKPYLNINYVVFEDETETPKYVSISANGYFDAFRTSNTDIGSEEWNAERDAAYKELCETGSKTLSMILKTDVTLNISDFTVKDNLYSIELKVESDVTGKPYEYTVKVNLNYTSDPYQNIYYWCGDLFIA